MIDTSKVGLKVLGGVSRTGKKVTGSLGVAPISVGSVDEFSDKLSPLSKTSLEARNTYANGVLVWAETGGDVRFARFRRAVFATEIARRARAWHDDVSDVSRELASARVEGLLAAMATGIKGRKPDEDYQRFFGPDIPRIVEGAYSSLRASADRHSS